MAYPLSYEKESLPCILFIHGYLGGERFILEAYYGAVIRALAGNGVVVVAPRVQAFNMNNFRDDMIRVMDYIFEQPEAHQIFKKIDPKRLGLFGHSMGAETVVSLATNSGFIHEYNIVAAVAVEPAKDEGFEIDPTQILIPMFFITDIADDIVPWQGVVDLYNGDPLEDKMLANGVGLGHLDIGYHGTQTLNPYMVQYLLCKVS